jgi:hypothetical protein
MTALGSCIKKQGQLLFSFSSLKKWDVPLSLVIPQAVEPSQILFNHVGDGQLVRAAQQAFPAFRAVSGLLN